jgi:hypothetical protein
MSAEEALVEQELLVSKTAYSKRDGERAIIAFSVE